jgi:hypothetical protein
MSDWVSLTNKEKGTHRDGIGSDMFRHLVVRREIVGKEERRKVAGNRLTRSASAPSHPPGHTIIPRPDPDDTHLSQINATPATYTEYLVSFHGLPAWDHGMLCFGGNLALTVNHDGKNKNPAMPARTSTVFLNPSRGNRLERTMGKMTPPRPDPQRMIPTAVALRLRNQWATTAVQGE